MIEYQETASNQIVGITRVAGIDVRTEAGLKRIQALFDAQNISLDEPADSSLEQYYLSGNIDTFLLTGEDTNNQYSLFDILVPPNAGPLTHFHTREDEAFYILQGKLTFQVGTEIFEGVAGDLIPYTRFQVHGFKNLESEPARILLLAAPSGLEILFREGGLPVTDPSAPVPPDVIERVAKAAAKIGIEFYPEAFLIGRDPIDDGGITIYGDERGETIIGTEGSDLILSRHGGDQIYGEQGNDILIAGFGVDALDGGDGNDLLSGREENDMLTGGGGQDTFLLRRGQGIDTITDFGGVGIGVNPPPDVIVEIDILQFEGAGLTAEYMILEQDDDNLLVTFEGVENTGAILENFALENLDNLSQSTGASLDIGNILFAQQTAITDSFDVFNFNAQRSRIFNKNTVTFLNNLDNTVRGFNHSDDVINGQDGNDDLTGLSGDDILRGGKGDDILDGGIGEDFLSGGVGTDSFILSNLSELDTVFDFEDGVDTIVLSDLTFTDLIITQSSDDTILGSSINEAFAVLTGVDAGNIDSTDFSFV